MSRATPGFRDAALVAVALVVLGVAATWPTFSDPATTSPAGIGNNDYWFNTWVVFWGAHALTTDPLGLHDANIFWPETDTFVYSDIELAHSVLVLPVIVATGNPVLTMNVLTLLSIVIGGTGAFVLGRRVTGSLIGGVATGLIFIFNDAHFARRLAVQFFGDHWLPWLALATLLWLDRRSRVWGLVAGVLFVLHATTGSHNAVFGALLVGVTVLVQALRSGAWRERAFWASTAAFVLLPLLVLAPLFYPYLQVQERMAGERGANAEVLRDGSARPIDLASGASRFHAWTEAATGWPAAVLAGPLRAHLFPGWIPLLLAVAALSWRRARQTPATFTSPVLWWALAALFFWLALGPPAGLYRLLSPLPGIQLIRVPSRFLLPGLLALSVLAGYGAARVARTRRGRILVAVLLGAFAVESAYAPVEATTLDLSADPVTAWIASQPGDFALLEVPVDADNLSSHARQTLFSIHHFRKLLVGYSGWRSPEVERRLTRIDRRFPSRAILNELVDLEVRYIVARESRLATPVLERMSEERRLREVFRHGDVSVWELRPPVGPR